MKAKRFLALLLSVIMAFGLMPLTAVHVHAEEYSWNPNATMTLKCGDVVVEPKEVIETADTKMKVYQINSISDYTLTTSADNDYAVFFEVNWSVISEDENGYKDYDYEMTVTLDNVTIRTYNPRVDQNEKIHAAITFSDEKCDERYETLNIQLVGDNTVELLGVKNDSLEDRWSAVSFIGPNTVIKGEGTLNATSRYSNAVGAVSALYTENSVGLYETVTLNATADVKAKEANTLIGDGLYFDDYEFIMDAGTTANIKASGSGIMHGTEHVRAEWLNNMHIDGDLDIRAADYGISWQSGGINMGDGSNLIIKGLSDASAPNVGILVRRGVVVGAGCTLEVDALGSAISCRAVTTANPSSPLIVGINSVVELSGSVDSNVFVLDCGTKLAGTNNVVSGNGEEWFGERYPVSELILEEGAKLTINGGYLALRAATMELKNGSELDIRTEKYPESDNVEESMAVYISTSQSYVRNGAKLNIEVASDYAIYGFTSLYLESNNVYLKSADSALYSGLGIYRGTDPVIYTFESDDGISWIPFANKNSKPYFTTKEPATHICAASRTANTYSDKVWTPIESEYKHTAKCIYCAADIVADCQWDRGAWYYSDGVYTLKFECEICERERFSDVEYHSHVFDTWTPLMGDYYPMHESTCTVPGCGASTEEYCSDSYSDEFHVSMTTLRKNCTKCGQYTEREIDISAVEITHVEAKPATCGEVGNTEFWICGHCNKYFSDEGCQHEVTPAQVYISPEEHKYVNNTCSNCGHNIKSARFEQSMDDTFSSDDRYLYVLIGKGSDGKLYAMGEATPDGRRYGVEIPNAQIDENGIITLNSNQAEFMDFEYYFENGSGATTTSTFMVDGNYMTARYGKIYTFPQDRLDDKNNPRPFSFRLESYSGESSLGYVDCDLYDPSDYSHTHEYITFNPETHYFEACEDRQYTVYLYRQVCDHEDIYLTHSTPVAPTCTEQGFSGDFWECTMCDKMFTDKSCSTELVLPDDCYDVMDYYQVNALGHSFNSEGVCKNCGMKRPVYKPVTSLEQFDQLSDDAYYIIVFKDGDKTYAAFLPDIDHVNDPLFADLDGNGIVDMMEPDANANGIPDCIETYIDTYWGSVDYNEDGICSVDEYNEAIGSMDGDEDVDADDYKRFFEERMYWDLYYEYENKTYNVPNIVEVTVAPDGSITIIDEGAMEFQMMPSGIWGGQVYDESELEYEGIQETERLRAAWVPNWWIANYGTMGEYGEEHFLTQNRWFGDREMPGVIDNKNWKISFNEDGTALLVSTWAGFDDSAALQLVKYTDADGNERITMIGCYGERWQYSDILSNCTVISGAYLYASEPVYAEPPHECIWGNWIDDDVTDTHTRKCTVDGCDKKQTENHNWDKGVETNAPTCTENGTTTYTCPDCKVTKTEPIPALDHDWGEWTYDSVDSHVRHCKRENCNAEDFGGHEWGTWVSVDENTHKMTCSVCNGHQTDEHEFDNGVETVSPTCYSTGVMTYTCGTCNHTKTEIIPMMDHTWTDWYHNGDENHKRDCMDDKCDKFETLPHEWDDGVITKEPTCKEAGVKTFTCLTCRHTRTEDVPTTDHVFGDWTPNNDGTTHSRYCSCNESETADHKFDNGEVTQAPTHEAMGERKYTCSDCGYFYTEDIPALTDHEWGDWVINKLDEANTHIRYCICGETQTAPHNFDEGVITEPATHTSKGVKTFTCTDGCGYSYTEEIPATPDHEWTDWSPNGDGTHTRACRCNANETKDCTYDDGVVTEEPTHVEPGTKLFTCTACGHTYEEDVPVLTDHEWGDWVINKLDEANTHIRYCICNESQTAPHNFDEGVITEPATHTSKGVKTFTCTDGCGYSYTEEIPATPDHEWTDWSYNGDGTHTRACRCNATETEDCTWDSGVVTQYPTHISLGTRTYTCIGCGNTKTEDIPTTFYHEWSNWVINQSDYSTHIRYCICNERQTAPHNFDEGVITEPATHTSKGVKTFTCYDCGYTYSEEIPTTPDHEWTDWSPNGDGTHTRACRCNANETKDCEWDDGVITKQPTHYEEGVKTFTCTVCGGEKTEPIVKTTEHEWTEWTPDNDDKTHTRLCKCGAFETEDHTFDAGTVTKEPTHLETGIKKFTCADCGFVREDVLNKTPEHTFGEWKPLATVSGKHYRECACGEQETADCAWDNGKITTNATHYKEGVKTFTCTVCKATKTESIAKTTAHEWSDWAKKDDKSHIRECKCGATETKDHAFDAGTVTKEPTHLETGVKKFTCADCGFVREDVLNKTPEHTFGEWKTEATVVGKHYRECACGEREIGDCTWDAGVVTTEPTYEATGTKTYTCTVCGGTKTETIDMLVKAEEIVSPENSDIKITTPEGSNAVLNENTVLKVEEVKDEVSEDVKANVEIVVGNDNAEVLASYDISLILDGATVQPGGTVEVTLPAPENAADFDTLQVVYIDDDGNVTPCETRVNADGTVTFVTDHFSHYAIVGVQNSSPLVWILISAISLALIAGAVVAVLVIKKKKGVA